MPVTLPKEPGFNFIINFLEIASDLKAGLTRSSEKNEITSLTEKALNRLC